MTHKTTKPEKFQQEKSTNTYVISFNEFAKLQT